MKKSTMVVSATLGAALLALTAPLAASAHVALIDNTAEAGSYAIITFKVPNESATAKTTKLVLHLPTDHPLASVSYVPVPGWTAELTDEKLATPVKVGESEITDAVTTVTWTAEPGNELGDGELQLFSLSVGPIPDVDKVQFTADQTYSDGSVVNWDDTSADADEPAPALYVNEAPPTDADDGVAVSATDAAAGPDVLARVLGILGLVVGVVGVVVAITTRRAAR